MSWKENYAALKNIDTAAFDAAVAAGTMIPHRVDGLTMEQRTQLGALIEERIVEIVLRALERNEATR